MYELILVSQSPRRRQILSEAGFLFSVDTVKLSEIIEENVNLKAAISKLARTKGEAYLAIHNHLKLKDILILTADTMVVLEGKVFGKPQNSAEAVNFLGQLSGKMHSVITGICVVNLKTGQSFEAADETKVEFRKLSQSEILVYVDSGEPMDKAGAYAIQGEGRQFVKNFEGSLTNVIGLPLELLEKTLNEKGWHVARQKPSGQLL